MHNAKAGGEYGANGEWYEGGQFVADREDWEKGRNYLSQAFDARMERAIWYSMRNTVLAMANVAEYEYRKLWDAESQHVGEIGDKFETHCEITGVFGFDSFYGRRYVVKMIDDDGNVFVWFTGVAATAVDRGDRVIVRGTIKDHDVYANVKQTVVTRCKLIAA